MAYLQVSLELTFPFAFGIGNGRACAKRIGLRLLKVHSPQYGVQLLPVFQAPAQGHGISLRRLAF